MRKASEIERLLMSCTTIWFSSGDNDKKIPEIILGFEDEVSGPMAYQALREWMGNDELIAALNRKEEFIEVTLINTGTYEAATVSDLHFHNSDMTDFLKKVSQNRRLALSYCVNPLINNRAHAVRPALPVLRYILVVGKGFSC